MIVVAGGTGRLGTRLVTRLVERDVEVRVVTRDPARASQLPSGVEIVVGDVRDPASLPMAIEGAEVVVSAVQGFAGPGRVSPASVDDRGNANVVDVAGRCGADVVLLSTVGASA